MIEVFGFVTGVLNVWLLARQKVLYGIFLMLCIAGFAPGPGRYS